MAEEDLHRLLSTIAEEKQEDQICNRFYSVLVPISWVARIHNISQRTVQRYIERGFINPEGRLSREEHYQFRLSEVLKMDFNKMQKQLRRNEV